MCTILHEKWMSKRNKFTTFHTQNREYHLRVQVEIPLTKSGRTSSF